MNFQKRYKVFVLTLSTAIGLMSISNDTNAQSKLIANQTKNAINVDKASALNLFSLSGERDAKIDASINNVVYLKLNKQALLQLNSQAPKTIDFVLPTKTGLQHILLYKHDIYASDFKAQVDRGAGYETVDKPVGNFYRGYVSGQDYSVAAISFYPNELGGVISIPGMKGNYNIVLNKENPGPGLDNYLLYEDVDIKDDGAIKPICDNDYIEENIGQKVARRTAGGENGLTCKTVSIALYGDYKMYLKNSSNLVNAQNYLTTVFNAVATLFENDNIRVALKLLSVSSVNDSMPTNSSSAVLKKFGNNMNTNVTGDLMQLVTGYTTGGGNGYAPLGGIAWLDVLCGTPFYYSGQQTYVGPFSIINTTGNANIPAVPTYSWDANCSIHEMGHNLGSPHTHACEWNGNNTAIDGCAPTYNSQYAEGTCPIGPIPSAGGTIMSYCHLLQNVGVNLANGFGPQPGELIRGYIDGATCLSSTYNPVHVLDSASKTVTANAYCINNDLIYFYDNKNDFDRTNDELILILENSNVSYLDIANLEVSMTTNANYGANIATDALTYNYVNSGMESWYNANRSWNINFNQVLPGTSKVSFPFLAQDRADLTGSYAALNNQNDSLKLLVYKTQTAALNPSTALSSDVLILNKGNASSEWVYGNNSNYNLATAQLTGTFYGGTFAAGKWKIPNGINDVNYSSLMRVFPNPAEGILNVQILDQDIKLLSLEILDYTGRVVFANSKQQKTQSIDINRLSAGVYLIKCNTNKGIYLDKFSKL